MKDLVLKGFVKSYAEENDLNQLNDSDVFESFAASVMLNKYHSCSVSNIDDFITGGGNDGGIDCAAILVNGRPVQSKEDLDFFNSRLRHLNFEFVFIQAKTSSEFDAGGIGTFLYGVSQFFADEPKIRFNEELQQLRELTRDVYDLSIAMDTNPSCNAYYVTSGNWNADPEPTARLESGKNDLEETHLFSIVNTVPIDSETLKTVYRELQRGVSRDIDFSKTVVFPFVDGVDEAYIGLLPGSQFLKLITNEDGSLNRDLFYDNVRDYQGNNPVNRDIASTISNSEKARFPLLNNGITIVARTISRTADTFRISDFQIVNGCQTTHVLHQNSSELTDQVFIPIKLVVTNDSALISDVIKATNWQTAVQPEALESLTPFHKEIEDTYNSQEASQPKNSRIYYERRSKQYHFDPIPACNIITLTSQTKSFVAMFLNEPHSHPRYYGELLKAYEHRIFVADHKPELYYAAGLAYSIINSLFNRRLLPKDYRSYAYHLLMLLRFSSMGKSLPKFNSNAASKYALELVDYLRNEDTCLDVCNKNIELISDVVSQSPPGSSRNPLSRIRAFTEALIEKVEYSEGDKNDTKNELKIGSIEQGCLLWFDDYKGFGFIERDLGGDVFVHASGLKNVPWKHRTEGTKLEYEIISGRKGPIASVIKVL